MEGSEKKESNSKKAVDSRNKMISCAIIILIVLAMGYFWGNKVQNNKITETNEVAGIIDISDWQYFESEKFGFSFKYPKGWKIEDLSYDNAPKADPIVEYIIRDEEEKYRNTIEIRVNNKRSIGQEAPENGIQTSITFDKQNYIIFSTASDTEKKLEFYNILATLEFGK